MAELAIYAWIRVMKQPAEKIVFQAGRDNRGAYATGTDSSARNIETDVYVENHTGPISIGGNQRSAYLRSFLPKQDQEILIDSHKYQVWTVEAVLLQERKYTETQQEPNGTIRNFERLQLFFRSGDSATFEEFWHNVSFPCPVGGWVTFLFVKQNAKQQIYSFCVHGEPPFWYKWPQNRDGVGIPITARKVYLLSSAIFLSMLVMFLNIYLKYQSSVVPVTFIGTVAVCFVTVRHEHERLNRSVSKAQEAVQFHRV